MSTRLNWLRAGVLGANDGIISTAGLVVGVAGATTSRAEILTAGVAGLLAGSLSMAVGEYVSVSSQRDSERAALELERRELAEDPEAELIELTELLAGRGLTREVAREAAEQLTERDALRAHARVELGIEPDELANPWHAALASLVAFTAGALLPLLAIVLPGASVRVPVTVGS
ncbi:VIT family protein, partial [Streptomyces polychromogenes]|nr:VIT family protein [Streptomyces polychromogenes]